MSQAHCSQLQRAERPNEGAGDVGTGRCCLAHLSPVVIDNDGALLIIHSDCAYVTLPCAHREQQLDLKWETSGVIYLPAAHCKSDSPTDRLSTSLSCTLH